ncbi:MAG: ATP-binding protein [Candidatus Promineifilaceae bacterium]|nr:ATP-binding protein [Candidatus Promineifilaceae bacterium]
MINLFGPPTFEDEDNARIASRLYTLLLAFLLVATALTIFYLVVQVDQLVLSVAITGASALLYLIAIWVLNRGYLRVAGGILILHLFTITTWIALNFDGIYDTSLVVYFLLIAVTGLLLGGNAALGTAALSILALTGIYFIDAYGVEVLRPPVQDPVLKVVEIGILLLLMGIVLRMTINDLNDALQRARREVAERKLAEEALARANRELEKARDKLEERVAQRTAELAQANRDLQTLIQSSQDGILFLSHDLRLSVINTRAIELLQLSGTVADWENRPALDIVTELEDTAPRAAEAAQEELQRFAEGARSGADGDFTVPPFSIYWYGVPVKVQGGKMAHLVVLRDITEQQRAEQMRNDLIRAMVHDLRNPLSGMLTALRTIEWLDKQGQAPLTAIQRRSVERTSESAERMVHLVDNILDVSRLESGQMPLAPAAIAVDDLVEKVVDSQLLLATEKQLTLAYDVEATLPPAWADGELLERILQNLLDNAIKFTPEGGHITVTARRRTPEGDGEQSGFIQISVADTGPGIPPSLQRRLFQKFVAGDEQDAGSGLGLAFCKLAVEAHGGDLWVQSQLGEGATFTFTVPVAQDRMREPAEKQTGKTGQPAPRSPER